jgi:hypothetical protein
MKHMKMLGLLATAAAALMAFAGTASADLVTSPPGTTYSGALQATSTNATLHNGVGTISCHSTVKGSITGQGVGTEVHGTNSYLDFVSCAGGTVHNATIKPGLFTLDVTKTNHGTLYSSGASVTVTMLGQECGYETNNTNIGTVTAGGEHAVLDISANLLKTHGGFFCGNTGNWTGSYTLTTPTNVHLDNT